MRHLDWWDKRNRQGTQPSLSPAHKPQAQPSQASTGQARPGHSRAQPSPSRGVGLAKAVPNAFSYRIQIKPSLAQPRPAQPTTQARSAQPKPSSQTASPVQPDQHRSGQARPQPSPAQPKPWCGPCQSCAKGFFLPDSDQAQPSSAQASPAHHAGQVSPAQAQLTNRKPSPARPAQVRPGQATAEPSPAQAVVWALPKLCQRLFLTGFRGAILGRRSAPFLLRFWPVWGRRAAAFRRFEG